LKRAWFDGANVLVVGLARSGRAACELLRRRGCSVTGSDSNPSEDFARSLVDLEEKGVRVVLGPQDEALLRGVDLVVVSPGVPPDIPLLVAADRAGMRVISELEAAYQTARAPVVAVTGTNGKSTCVEMLGCIFRASGRRVEVAGNVGRPLSDVAEAVSPEGVLVAEVSSFQLERIEEFRPRVAVLLNVTQDHLDRHGGMKGYLSSKLRIFDNQGEGDTAIVNQDQAELASALKDLPAGRRMAFSVRGSVEEGAFVRGREARLATGGREEVLFRADRLRVPGPHNLANALAAAAAARAEGAVPEAIGEGLGTFAGLEHRMEEVAVREGVTFVNDSKATNPDSLRQALRAVEGKALLIAGGRDKGMSFEELEPLVLEKTRKVFLIGEAADRLRRAWPRARAVRAQSLEDAVRMAWESSEPGDWVLLSPGCASFDMFENFEDRGRRFKELVHALGRRQGVS